MEICRAVKAVKDGAEVELSRFPSGEQELLNVLREFRWMGISGARGFIADEIRDRVTWLNQAPTRLRRRPLKLNRVEL